MRRVVIILAAAVLTACSASTGGHPAGARLSPAGSHPRPPAPATPDTSAPSRPCHGTVAGHDRPYDVELCSAMAIPGVQYHTELDHLHQSGTIRYDLSPPVGGDHSPLWANCVGTVYTHPIANENAVHMLEHGAVWITYNPQTADSSVVAALSHDVAGVNYTALSPYPGLRSPISLQAWGYQLFVDSPSDPRIARFLAVLRHDPRATPEPNVSCDDPYFHASQSYPGHPQEY
jgi:hypothetical protein